MNTNVFAVDRIQMQKQEGAVKAYVSLKIADSFIVRNVRIVSGKKGLFVSMPAEKYQDQNKESRYAAIAFPINREMHETMQAVVLDAYAQARKDSSGSAQV